MQLVSCCIDRNRCSPVVPTVETWTVKATKVCQLSALRPAEGSVSQAKRFFTAPMARCTIFLRHAQPQRISMFSVFYDIPQFHDRVQKNTHWATSRARESRPYPTSSLQTNVMNRHPPQRLKELRCSRKCPPFVVPECSLTCSVTPYFFLASNVLSPSHKLEQNIFQK